uniref:CX domain-containing protein n=1 Tax=Syphacia muris TaxID=451379 RepID=A0A0N5AJ29_9BILA
MTKRKFKINLSGKRTTNGDEKINADVLNLITVGLLGGYAVREIKAYNDRIYLERYRRSYWLGEKYYKMDNLYYLASRDTCFYHLNETERKDLKYEDDWTPITTVVYQCQRYAQYCCGLDCCDSLKPEVRSVPERKMKYPWFEPSSSAISMHYSYITAVITLSRTWQCRRNVY